MNPSMQTLTTDSHPKTESWNGSPTLDAESGQKSHAGGENGLPVLDGTSDTDILDEKRLIRKLDWHLIPWLSFLYVLCFLDRSSIGNAKLYGMQSDIGFSDSQYNIALMVFFFPYALCEAPSNIILKRFRPSKWFSIIMILWGATMTAQGLVHNYSALVVLRFLMGTFEAGFYPGVNYYLSCWYKRSEFGLRAVIFFAATTFAGTFGGLLAAAIANMDGLGGKPAWAWIFILEGSVTIAAAAISFWIIQDFPEDAKFLTEHERAAVVTRLQVDGRISGAHESFHMRNFLQALFEWKTLLAMLLYAGAVCPLYAISLFLPSLIRELGFSATRSNILTVPVYALACIATLAVGLAAHRGRKHGLMNIVLLCIAIAGCIILIASRNATLSYVGTYVAAIGIFPVFPNTVVWISNNTEGSYKRGVVMGLFIGFGNLNGAVSSNIYRSKERPWYTLGHSVVLGYLVVALLSTFALIYMFKRENALRDRGERDEVLDDMSVSKEESDEERERRAKKNGRYASLADAVMAKGDLVSTYRYTL